MCQSYPSKNFRKQYSVLTRIKITLETILNRIEQDYLYIPFCSSLVLTWYKIFCKKLTGASVYTLR